MVKGKSERNGKSVAERVRAGGFLFGADKIEHGKQLLNIDDAYVSLHSPGTNPQFLNEHSDENTPVQLTAIPRAGLTLFDLIAPFARFYFVHFAAFLLIKLTALIPHLLPTPAHIAKFASWIAVFVLISEFLRVVARNSNGRWSAFLPSRSRMDQHGRRFLRRSGRVGWFAWYLSKPFWVVLEFGGVCVMALGVFSILRGIWNVLPEVSPVPSSVSQPSLRGPLMLVRVSRYILFFMGLVFALTGFVQTARGRSGGRHYFSGVVSWVMAVCAQYTVRLGDDCTGFNFDFD